MLSQKPLYKLSGMWPCIIVQEKPRSWLLHMCSYTTNTSQESFQHLAEQGHHGHGLISIHLLQYCKAFACWFTQFVKLILCSMMRPSQNHHTDNSR
ncbi:hypothetical protein AVEN_149201-1 [Araneus ventricosus]|uniref:Uncharacterized protein n=1 Tax=Araneus ventricosus TaxID=182803 RepID=A0A4Y2IK66_ARAVE|nr:hypothetical protein AVEN_149201-1 [Araneus ventricosus]